MDCQRNWITPEIREQWEKLVPEIAGRKEEILRQIQKIVRINSVGGDALPGAPFGEGPREALRATLAMAEEMGLEAVNLDDYVGYAEIGSGDEMVAVLGHLDVVPEGDGWTVDPFGAEIRDGKMYGRGTQDDKSPTIGALCVLKAISDLKIPLKRRIRVIFGTNEERGSDCIRHYVETNQEKPVLGFTPDADYPLIYFEKGMTGVTIGVKQPQQGQIRVLSLTGGEASNIVPKSCQLVLEGEHPLKGHYEGVSQRIENGKTWIEGVGISAHGSMPERGVNAIMRVMEASRELGIGGDFEKLQQFVCEKICFETNGESLGVCYQDEETGVTTNNMGLISQDEDSLWLHLDIRYPKNGDPEAIRETLKKAAKEKELEVLEIDQVPMLYVPKESKLVSLLMSVYQEATGDTQSEPEAIGGGTYAKVLPNIVAFGPTFPGDPITEHQPDEFILVDRLMEGIEITARAMVAMANS